MADISQNKTVLKSLEILNLFLRDPRLSLNQMIERLGRPKTSVYRMVRSLEEMGLLTKQVDGRYVLGLTFLQFGQLVSERLDIRRIALPLMESLRDKVDEAVNLIVRDHYEAVYIEKVDTTHPVRVYNERPGLRVPLFAGACPRILLAYMPEDAQKQYFQQVALQTYGHGTITNLTDLQSVIREARRNGYTISHSELMNDTSAVAAPIFNHLGQTVAAFSIAGPTSRFTADVLPKLIRALQQATAACSSELGYGL